MTGPPPPMVAIPAPDPVTRIDRVILICRSCGRDREHYPDAILEGAKGLMAWLHTVPGPCPCGSKNFDAQAHVMEDR